MIFLQIFQMRWPEYAGYIFLEYFVSKTNPDETYVTVNFAGEVNEKFILEMLFFHKIFCLAPSITELWWLLLPLFDILNESGKTFPTNENTSLIITSSFLGNMNE